MEYKLGRKVIDGGEGTIYEIVGQPDLLIKTYKQNAIQSNAIINENLAEKLEYMKNNPPLRLLSKGCLSWPIDIVYSDGELIGFIMTRLKFDITMLQFYAYKNPIYDTQGYERFPSVKTRISTAIELVNIVAELHDNGYIIGDFNHENIGVDILLGQIQIVDCDSFHIIGSNGITYRTEVVMPGYLAPEIIRHCQNERINGRPYRINDVCLPTFSIESDLFCLAKHVFKLLMNGADPFTGILENTTGSIAEPFQGNEAIERNAYIFKSGYYSNSTYCPAADEIPSYLNNLFYRAFVEGHNNPRSRPNTQEWNNALTMYLYSLCQCSTRVCFQKDN